MSSPGSASQAEDGGVPALLRRARRRAAPIRDHWTRLGDDRFGCDLRLMPLPSTLADALNVIGVGARASGPERRGTSSDRRRRGTSWRAPPTGTRSATRPPSSRRRPRARKLPRGPPRRRPRRDARRRTRPMSDRRHHIGLCRWVFRVFSEFEGLREPGRDPRWGSCETVNRINPCWAWSHRGRGRGSNARGKRAGRRGGPATRGGCGGRARSVGGSCPPVTTPPSGAGVTSTAARS